MPDGQVLEFSRITKRFGAVTAVSDFSASIEPGSVTAFLGPNGAGKTTTLRILLGQLRATSGTATIGGTPYADLRHPLRTIGAVLEETSYRPRRTAARQLTIAAKANGIPLSRVAEVLSLVGLDSEAETRIGSYSLGMRQRISVATALLGDPGALVFDEPANGLDPEGIRWMRLLMRRLADEGRTVLVSSHVLSEVEQVADNVLVLSKGHLVMASGIEELADPRAGTVVVDADDRDALTAALSAAGLDFEVLRSGLNVRGADAATVGAVAASAGVALSTLLQRRPTLEDVFIDLVRGGKLEPRAEDAASRLAPPASAAGSAVDAAGLETELSELGMTEAEEAEVSAAGTDPTVAPGAEQSGAGAAAATWPAVSAPEPLVPTGTEAHADEIEPSGTEQDAPEQAETEQAETSDDSGQPFPRGLGAFAVDAAPLGASSAPLSFDEIVFGTAEPSATDEDDSDASGRIDAAAAVSAPDHTVEADDDATRVLPVVAVTGEDDEEPTEDEPLTEESLANESLSEEPLADESVADEGPADEPLSDEGIEIFAALQEDDASAPEADDDSPEASPSGSDDASDSGASDEEDPRSASVSSMLAAAARAYFDEEPKDYPLQRQDETESAPSPWVAASTGAGETVPPASEDDQATDASGNSSDRDGDDSPEHGHDSHEHGDGHHRD